jgi:hypothetical protein
VNLAPWLNGAWMVKCLPETAAFLRATRRVAHTQIAVLQTILRRNRNTAFGRRHGFARITHPRAYQERVPLMRYESYEEDIAAIAAGRSNVLTQERVELLEPTSGTTRGEKLIPYTASLRRQFQRAVAAWIGNLFWERPAVRSGRAYWSISPAIGRCRRTPGGIPIGFEEDADYLGGLERAALARLLVVPGAVAGIADIDAFRYCTCLCLLRAEDLSLISVWNPTFLTILVQFLEAWQERLSSDLRRGSCSGCVALPPSLARLLTGQRRSDRRRADQLDSLFRSGGPLGEKLRAIWPKLALISCWADGAAARDVTYLRELFPAVEIQPKGLLATEGCVSFPLVGRPAPALAIRSHFFEFEEFREQSGGRCLLAHELSQGGRYRVVLTTAGGLYRYQLSDIVEVAGFENDCPLLRFLGKGNLVSDLVGEKLAEPHVRDVLDRLLAAHELMPRFALLVPVLARPPRYRLYLQGRLPRARISLHTRLAEGLKRGLEENPHYVYAVRLGQLAPAEVRLLDTEGESGWLAYERRCLGWGQKPGDIKPVTLHPWTGWPAEFELSTDHRPSERRPVPVQSP